MLTVLYPVVTSMSPEFVDQDKSTRVAEWLLVEMSIISPTPFEAGSRNIDQPYDEPDFPPLLRTWNISSSPAYNRRIIWILPSYFCQGGLVFGCLYLSVCLFVCLSAHCLPACLSVCLSVWLTDCLSTCLPTCLSVYLSVCLSVCLLVYLFAVCLPACLSVCLAAFLSVIIPMEMKGYLWIFYVGRTWTMEAVNKFGESFWSYSGYKKIHIFNVCKLTLAFCLTLLET